MINSHCWWEDISSAKSTRPSIWCRLIYVNTHLQNSKVLLQLKLVFSLKLNTNKSNMRQENLCILCANKVTKNMYICVCVCVCLFIEHLHATNKITRTINNTKFMLFLRQQQPKQQQQRVMEVSDDIRGLWQFVEKLWSPQRLYEMFDPADVVLCL